MSLEPSMTTLKRNIDRVTIRSDPRMVFNDLMSIKNLNLTVLDLLDTNICHSVNRVRSYLYFDEQVTDLCTSLLYEWDQMAAEFEIRIRLCCRGMTPNVPRKIQTFEEENQKVGLENRDLVVVTKSQRV